MIRIAPPAAALLLLAACSRPAPPPAAPETPATAAATPNDTHDPQAFAPLRSAAVKDAIHRALRTGQAQRWQDGALSGYAVPSAATDRNGCRAVRYTIDQAPGAPWRSINACDANPGAAPPAS